MDDGERGTPKLQGADKAAADFNKELLKKFGGSFGHPGGHTENGTTCHLLLTFIARKDMGGNQGRLTASRVGVAELLEEAFGVKVKTIYQPLNNFKAWMFPVTREDADKLRQGVFRLAPDFGFRIWATYPDAPKRMWAYAEAITENVSMEQLALGVRSIPRLEGVERLQRVSSQGLLTERVKMKVKWADVDLTKEMTTDVLGIIKGYWTRTFVIAGETVRHELHPFIPCLFCGFVNHFFDACPWLAQVEKAPLIQLRSFADPESPKLAPAPSPATVKEPTERKRKSKKAASATSKGVKEKAPEKRKEETVIDNSEVGKDDTSQLRSR